MRRVGEPAVAGAPGGVRIGPGSVPRRLRVEALFGDRGRRWVRRIAVSWPGGWGWVGWSGEGAGRVARAA